MQFIRQLKTISYEKINTFYLLILKYRQINNKEKI